MIWEMAARDQKPGAQFFQVSFRQGFNDCENECILSSHLGTWPNTASMGAGPPALKIQVVPDHDFELIAQLIRTPDYWGSGDRPAGLRDPLGFDVEEWNVEVTRVVHALCDVEVTGIIHDLALGECPLAERRSPSRPVPFISRNPSTYLQDSAVWTACPESRDQARRMASPTLREGPILAMLGTLDPAPIDIFLDSATNPQVLSLNPEDLVCIRMEPGLRPLFITLIDAIEPFVRYGGVKNFRHRA